VRSQCVKLEAISLEQVGMTRQIVAPIAAETAAALDAKRAPQQADEPRMDRHRASIDLFGKDWKQARKIAVAHITRWLARLGTGTAALSAGSQPPGVHCG
jgi:hypothetical protein